MADQRVIVGNGLAVNAAVRAGVMTMEMWLSQYKEQDHARPRASARDEVAE